MIAEVLLRHSQGDPIHHLRACSAGTTTLLVALLATTTTVSLEVKNWLSFRGADALPIADDDWRLPLTLSTTEHVVWQTPIDGLGPNQADFSAITSTTAPRPSNASDRASTAPATCRPARANRRTGPRLGVATDAVYWHPERGCPR